MGYPEFNSFSLISLIISFCSLWVLCFFITKIAERIKRVEKRLKSIIENLNRLQNSAQQNSTNQNIRKNDDIEYMDGNMDLFIKNKRASFRAIYYPKKVKKK